MAFVHHCHFCGESREAASATIVRPFCAACGCILRSLPAAEWTELQLAATAEAPDLLADVPRLSAAMRRAGRMAGVAAMLFLAAHLALPLGLPAALVALGLTGFVALPVLLPVEGPRPAG